MLRNLSLLLIVSIAGISLSCATATAPGNVSPNTSTTLPANSTAVPPEFSGNAVPTNSNGTVSGIPDPKTMNTNVSKGTTPTPGIPDPKELNKPQPKNTPKIPGIPTEKELKEMQNRKVDPSEVNNPKGLLPPSNSNTAVNTGTLKTIRKQKPE